MLEETWDGVLFPCCSIEIQTKPPVLSHLLAVLESKNALQIHCGASSLQLRPPEREGGGGWGELSHWLMPGRASLASFPGPGSLLPAGCRGRRPVSGATFWKGLVSSHSPAVTCASLQLLPSFLLASRRAQRRARRCLRFLPVSGVRF